MKNLKNKTALITGASSGIGKEIAKKLAKAGVNLVMTARSEASLAQFSEELKKDYGIQSVIFAADLSMPNCAPILFQQIESRNIKVDILINNAGVGRYGLFETISPEDNQEEITVNISALVAMTHAFLPAMLSRGFGAILNVASTASFQPLPYMAVYAASKSFVLSFSEALWVEHRKRGIHVVALCPGPVDTNFVTKLGGESTKTSAFSKNKLISPETVAEEAIKALLSRSPTRVIGFKNWLMVNMSRFTPRNIVVLISGNMTRPSK